MDKTSPRWWDLPSAVLLFVAFIFITSYLEATNWSDGLGHVRNITLYGLIIGLLLGVSRFKIRGVRVIGLGYMVVLFCWQWLSFMEFPEDVNYIGTKFLILGNRIGIGIGELFANRPIEDPLFFIALLSIPYCLAAIFSGYQLTRYSNGIAAILPGGILMLSIFVNLYTEKDYSWLFAVYIFFSIVLLGRQKFIVDKKGWYRDRIQFSSETGSDLNNIVMASAALVIFLVWTVPKALPFIKEAKADWDRTSNELWGDNEQLDSFFAPEDERTLPISSTVNRLNLGTEITQSEKALFLVYVPPDAKDIPRLYWRGKIYNIYSIDHWQTANDQKVPFAPEGGNFIIPDTSHRRFISFTFYVLTNEQPIIYTASQPIWVNHKSVVDHFSIGPKNGGIDDINTDDTDVIRWDIFSLISTPSLSSGESYSINSLMASPSIRELREASVEYPDWVIENYLQHPQDLSPRITELAYKLSEPFDNPYDKTIAITNYLRENINYSPVITFPENGVKDPIEYFLFESKQGFCNYYASAEVLMLRSIGIPSRLAVGYAAGEPNEDLSVYTVREKDYHAWPEVYFPTYGWIEFEPTGNQNPVERPLEPAETQNTVANQPLTPMDFNGFDNNIQRQPIGGLTPEGRFFQSQLVQAGLIILAILIFILGNYFSKKQKAFNLQPSAALTSLVEKAGWTMPAWLINWNKWDKLSIIEKYFQSVNISLNWFGKSQPVHITPSERASTLKQLLPSASSSIEVLLQELESSLFSPRGGNVKAARKAAGDIIYQFLISRLKFFILGYN